MRERPLLLRRDHFELHELTGRATGEDAFDEVRHAEPFSLHPVRRTAQRAARGRTGCSRAVRGHPGCRPDRDPQRNREIISMKRRRRAGRLRQAGAGRRSTGLDDPARWHRHQARPVRRGRPGPLHRVHGHRVRQRRPLSLEARQRLPQHAFVERHLLDRTHIAGDELLAAQIHDAVSHLCRAAAIVPYVADATDDHRRVAQARRFPALRRHRLPLERWRVDQRLLELREIPRREHPVDPQRDFSRSGICLDVRSKRRDVGHALRHADPDRFRLQVLHRTEPQPARRHQLIDAAGFQEILQHVHGDREPDA